MNDKEFKELRSMKKTALPSLAPISESTKYCQCDYFESLKEVNRGNDVKKVGRVKFMNNSALKIETDYQSDDSDQTVHFNTKIR